MKINRYSLVNIVFFLFIAVVGVLFYVLPDKPTVSEREKRELAKAPDFSVANLLDGSYTSDYSVYFADNFPFREQLITVSQRIKEYSQSTDEEGGTIIIVQNNDSGTVEDFDDEEPAPDIVIPVTSTSDSPGDPITDPIVEPEEDPRSEERRVGKECRSR